MTQVMVVNVISIFLSFFLNEKMVVAVTNQFHKNKAVYTA